MNARKESSRMVRDYREAYAKLSSYDLQVIRRQVEADCHMHVTHLSLIDKLICEKNKTENGLN